MYDMYPDGWTASVTELSTDSAATPPRRRARKEHSVEPAVLVRHAQRARDEDAKPGQES